MVTCDAGANDTWALTLSEEAETEQDSDAAKEEELV